MIDSTLSNKFISYFTKLIAFYKDFFALESTKYNDIKSGNFKMLDGHMKKEQVFIMKAKGLEVERQKLMDQTEKPKATFKEIIPLFDDGKRGQLQALYGELSSVVTDFKKLNTNCNALTESKLRRASFVLSKLKNSPELRKTYNEKVKQSLDPGMAKFLSEKV